VARGSLEFAERVVAGLPVAMVARVPRWAAVAHLVLPALVACRCTSSLAAQPVLLALEADAPKADALKADASKPVARADALEAGSGEPVAQQAMPM
jgi:hypothetical protein